MFAFSLYHHQFWFNKLTSWIKSKSEKKLPTFKKMKFKIFFLFYFWSLTFNRIWARIQCPDTPLMATVKTVSKEADTSCIILLYTSGQMAKDSKRITGLIKSMAMDFSVDVSITGLTFGKFADIILNRYVYLDCTSPITLIIHDDEETRFNLMQVSQSYI